MRKLFQIIVLLLSFESVFAQSTYDLWPIQGAKVGEGVLYRPNDYIVNELNIENLIIGAEENTNVLCPKDGKITSIAYVYHSSLANLVSTSINAGKVVLSDQLDKGMRINLAAYINKGSKGKPADSRFVSLSITITTGKGENYVISGLRPVKLFKTGELVRRGDVIAKVGYCYWKIDKPSISFSRSLATKAADPMTVFGLKTTFSLHAEKKIDYLTFKHPADSLLKAFYIFRSALEEGHPGLYDYTARVTMDSIFEDVKNKIKPMTSEEFRNLLLPVMLALRDSHTALRASQYKIVNDSEAPVVLGVVDGKLIVLSCIDKYKIYLGQEVIKVNAEDANELIQKVRNTVVGVDGFIESSRDRALMNSFMKYYRMLYQVNDGFLLNLTLATGEHLEDRFSKTNRPEPNVKYDRTEQANFRTQTKANKYAYLCLNTFDLLQKEEDEIQNFIKDIVARNIQSLIIDLRFNHGGSPDVMNNLFALFANVSFQSNFQRQVNKNDTYDFFKYTSNFANTGNVFPEYKSVDGKTGYYLNAEHSELIKPNENFHFDGTVYVLTNEYSFSASAVFAGLMLKYNRGTIVGRETGSTYYQLNAESFARVMLAETGLELYMPLVKDIFSEDRIPRIPWGRGVIPDYIINPTVDEAYQKEDKILNFTYDLLSKIQ